MAITEHTPVVIKPIPEATTHEEVDTRFIELMSGQIPGFVLRQADTVYGGMDEAMAAVTDKVRQDHVPDDHELKLNYEMPFADEYGDQTPSDWHTDDEAEPDATGYGLHLHRIVTGQAEVKLAKVGPDLRGDRYERNASDELKELIRSGSTDPTVMDPTVYSSTVNEGDMTIFPTSGKRPAWHSFQTTGDKQRETLLRSVAVKPKEAEPDEGYGDD